MKLEISKKLADVVYARTSPFCYSCYKIAKKGKCDSCGSDDLMRHKAGSGVEYGTEWAAQEIVSEHCTPVDVDLEFEEYVYECFPSTIDIGWLRQFDMVTALKELDPLSFEFAKREWLDFEECEDRLISLDGGQNYYRVDEVMDLE